MLIWIVVAVQFLSFWSTDSYYTLPWIPDEKSLRFAAKPLLPPLQANLAANYTLPLKTKGRHIVDQTGRRFKLLSVNWYGASDELFVVGGLEVLHRSALAEAIKNLGFNSVRLPYADELVVKNPIVQKELLAANPDLVGLRALDVFEAAVSALTDAGLAVIVNNHITSATWCCGANPCDAGWQNDHLLGICRVGQTEAAWIDNWETVMKRFVRNPLVIGADLRNEVRGLWGTMPWSKWATAAEKCGNRLLKLNPNWLIVVEGTESANDLSGAAHRPVVLDVANRLVYSAHVYRWSGWGSFEGRFGQRTYASFSRAMQRNWAYLLEQNIAPVWVGELGASVRPTVADYRYWSNLWRYLKSVDTDFGYWALNPRKGRDNVSESYSILHDDWTSPVLDYRMKAMQELIRQK